MLEHQRAIVDEIERHPARFMLRGLPITPGAANGEHRLRAAAAAVGAFVGVPGDELVFVENIAAAANAVLRSFPFAAGDEIAVTSLGYGGVTNAATFAARVSGATLRTIPLPPPGAPADAYVDAVAAGLGPNPPARRRPPHVLHGARPAARRDRHALPRARRARASPTARTCPGTAVDIDALGVDWYAATCTGGPRRRAAPHPVGAPERRSTLPPAVISWGLDDGMPAEFDIVGTRDPSSFLAAPFAIELLRSFGGDEGVEAVYRCDHGSRRRPPVSRRAARAPPSRPPTSCSARW